MKPETVIYMIHTINKNERGRAVESYKLRGTHSPKVYTLGPRGCQIVGKTLGIKVEYYPFSKRQGRHYCGINDILYRIVKALGIDNVIQRVKWWNTRGAKQVIFNEWAQTLAQLGRPWDEEQAKEGI
ncbi:hypothetical protein [Polycladomyces subterraneus]|uniref:Uncharacterized protein n=1 Tax=Polycladomyces subterraneus TaxID=1016997 RepID=A0ABT8IQY8_9BACL|nr:hypothetical protein [Polycladomyces subterraneus]MDN4595150.1 hypothetical protein [Polycladomyces subterraneus]